MRGGANEFHASLVGLVMRLGADERGQKRMMDVDDLLRVVPDEFRGKHLHVARQHDQVNVVFAQQREFLLLGFRFAFFCDRDEGVRNVVEIAWRWVAACC